MTRASGISLDTFRSKGFVAVNDALNESDLSLLDRAFSVWLTAQVADWGDAAPMANFRTDFYQRWLAAGRPPFRRSPQRNLVQREMFEFLRSDAMLKVASTLLETNEISVHGIFNARPMVPGSAPTPWHQDAQYYRSHGEADPTIARRARVLTIWVPLQDLDAQLGGLEVAALSSTRGELFADDHVDPETNLLMLPGDVMKGLHGEIPLLKRGGCIAFTNLTAHRGTANNAGSIRWSFDVRYEATEGAIRSGRRYGFVAASPSGRFPEDTFATWQKRVERELALSSTQVHDRPMGDRH